MKKPTQMKGAEGEILKTGLPWEWGEGSTGRGNPSTRAHEETTPGVLETSWETSGRVESKRGVKPGHAGGIRSTQGREGCGEDFDFDFDSEQDGSQGGL